MRNDRDVTVIESDSGGGIKWFLLGAAIGAGAALLFAPQSGERTRRDLVNRGRNLRDRAGDLVGEYADDVVAEVQEGKSKLQRTASTARESMERRLADARSRARAAVGADGVDEGDDESA